jgi:hypothetical protein
MVLFWYGSAMAEFTVSVPSDPTCGELIWNSVEVQANGVVIWSGDQINAPDGFYQDNRPGETITVNYLPAVATCDWGHNNFGTGDAYHIIGIEIATQNDKKPNYLLPGTSYTFVDEDHTQNSSVIVHVGAIYTDGDTAANPPVIPSAEGTPVVYPVSKTEMFKDPVTINIDLNGDGIDDTRSLPWNSIPGYQPSIDTKTRIKLQYFEKRVYEDAGLITSLNFEPLEETTWTDYVWIPNWGVPFGHPVDWGIASHGLETEEALIDRSRIVSVFWENKIASVSGPDLQYLHDWFMFVPYDMGQRFWFGDPCGWDPYEQGCEGGFTLADNYYRAPFFGIEPDSEMSQTFTVTVDGTSYEIVIGPSDFEKEIPVIPSFRQEQNTIYNKNGKEIAHGLSKDVDTVKNITAEYDSAGNLIVQWPEPIIAVPGIELKMSVMGIPDDFDITNPEIVSYASNFGGSFLWVDSPSQLGTVIIPANELNALRARSSYTRGVLRIVYRDKQRPSVTINGEDAGQITTRNRGLSALVEFVLQ